MEAAPRNLSLAPAAELAEAAQAAVVRGRVLDSSCRAVAGAAVQLWYAGGGADTGSDSGVVTPAAMTRHVLTLYSIPGEARYTFRPDELFYRGKSSTSEVSRTE